MASHWGSGLNALLDSSDDRCRLRMVDTVFFDRSPGATGFYPRRWLFTSKNGTVSKKKDENVTFGKIKERYSRFALANPNNVQRHVCWLISPKGGRTVLDASQFDAKLATAADSGLKDAVAMQCYLQPQGGGSSFYRHESTRDASSGKLSSSVALVDIGTGRQARDSSKAPVDAALAAKIAKIGAQIRSYLEQSRGGRLTQLAADFIVDDNGDAWLANLPVVLDAESRAGAAGGGGNKSKKAKGGKSKGIGGKKAVDQAASKAHSQSLPSLRPGSGGAQGDKTQGDKAQGTVGRRRPGRDLERQRERAAQAAVSAAAAGTSCDGEFCHVPCGTLRGLGLAQQQQHSSQPAWRLDLKRARQRQWRGGRADEDESSGSAVVPDTGQRFELSHKELLLAKGQLKFIRGEVNVAGDDPIALAKRWQEVDKGLRADLGLQQPGAVYRRSNVCANCFGVYHQLQRLRSRGFVLSDDDGMDAGRERRTGATDAARDLDIELDMDQDRRPSSRPSSEGSHAGAGGFEMTGSDEARKQLASAGKLGDINADAYGSVASGATKPRRRQVRFDKGPGTGSDPVGTVWGDESAGVGGGSALDALASHDDDATAKTKEHGRPPLPHQARKRVAGGAAPASSQSHDDTRAVQEAEHTAGGGDSQLSETERRLMERYKQTEDAKSATAERNLERERAAQEAMPQELARAQAAAEDVRTELAAARSRLSSEQQLSAKLHVQLKELSKKYTSAKREFATALREKEEQARRSVLEAEERGNRELAAASGSSAGADGKSAADGGTSARLVRDLTRKVELLERQHMEAREEWNSAKRDMQAAQTAEVGRLERRRAEESEIKLNVVRNLEAKVAVLEVEASDYRKEAAVATRMRESAQRQLEEANAAHAKAEQESRVLQQSLQSMSSMGVQGGGDGEVTGLIAAGDGSADHASAAAAFEGRLAAQKATYEARERQLQNKVQYLKAQLGSETKCKDSLEKSLGDMQTRLTTAADDKRKALHAAEEQKKVELKQLQQKMEQQLEVPRAEVVHMKEKVMQLQSQMSDMIQDCTLAKKKEEQARLDATRANEQCEFLGEETAKLNRALEELQLKQSQQADVSGTGEAHRAAMEAMMRRVENEREYMKSQLDTELECKEQLQTALDKVNVQFAEAQARWKDQAEDAETARRNGAQESQAALSELRAAKISLEGEVAHLGEQLTEARAATQKHRDEAHDIVQNYESARATVSKLQGELIAAKEDALRERRLNEAEAERQVASLQHSDAARHQAEKESAARVKQVQAELSKKTQKLSAIQKDMIAQQDEIIARDEAHQRTLGAERLGSVLQKIQQRRHHAVITRWSRRAAEAAAEEEAAARAQAAEEAARAEADAVLKRTVAGLQATIDQLREQGELEVEEARRKSLADARVAAKLQLEHALHEAMQEAEAKHRLALDEAAHAAKRAKQADAKRWMEKMAERKRDADKDKEAAVTKALEQARVEAEKLRAADAAARENAAKAAVAAVADEAESRAAAMKDAYKAEQAKLKAATAAEAAATAKAAEELRAREVALAVETATDAARQELRDQKEQAARELEEALQLLRAESRVAETAAREDAAKAAAAQREQHEVQMAEVRETSAQQLRAAVEGFDAKLEREVKDAVQQATDKANTLKANAIMVTTAKWQKTLEECEAKMELERKTARVEGMKESDATFRQATEETKRAHAAQIQQVREEAKSARAALEARLQEAQKHSAEAAEESERKLQAFRDSAEAGAAAVRASLEKEFKESMDAAVAAARQEETKLREEAVAAAQREADATMRAALEQRGAELESQLQNMRSAAVSARDGAVATARAETNARLELQHTAKEKRLRENHHAEMQRMREELEAARDQALEETRKAGEEMLRRALEECEQEAAREQQEALDQMQEESEKLIVKVEQAMETLKHEKEGTERELEEVKQQLEESEDTVFDLQNASQKLKQQAQQAELEAQAVLEEAKNEAQRDIEMAHKKMQLQHEENAGKHDKEAAALRKELRASQADVVEATRKMETMHDTLVNHKREVLLEHKIQSEVIQSDIKLLLDQTDEIEGVKASLQQEMSTMEQGVQDLEEQLRAMGKESAIKDGRVNVAHAKKKRRLDEEFEALLEGIEEKRTQLSGVDEKLLELNDQRQSKEDDMKDLERNLVEVMVEQQKKLLKTLTEARAGKHKQ